MSEDVVLYELKDHTAVLTLNRPDRLNAWNPAVASAMSDCLNRANLDDRVRAIVITGAGRAFCAGADLQGGGGTFASREERNRRDDEEAIYPHQLDKPVIAAINGAAVGLGMTYPLLCDIRIVAEDAKLGFVFTRRGIIPELASHLVLQRVIGFSNAADLLMSGRFFTGREAGEMGFANQVVSKEDVLNVALSKASEYALTAPASVAISKRLLWEGLSASLREMRDREHVLLSWAGNQADATEGVVSFIEKRRPEWRLSAQDAPLDAEEPASNF